MSRRAAQKAATLMHHVMEVINMTEEQAEDALATQSGIFTACRNGHSRSAISTYFAQNRGKWRKRAKRVHCIYNCDWTHVLFGIVDRKSEEENVREKDELEKNAEYRRRNRPKHTLWSLQVRQQLFHSVSRAQFYWIPFVQCDVKRFTFLTVCHFLRLVYTPFKPFWIQKKCSSVLHTYSNFILCPWYCITTIMSAFRKEFFYRNFVSEKVMYMAKNLK